MRFIALFVFTLLISIYAWKDWYKGLCGAITMMAVYGHDSMPSAMFGISGLNPWNFVFANVLGAWFVSSEKLKSSPPTYKTAIFLIIGFTVLMTNSIVRYDAAISNFEFQYGYAGYPVAGTGELFFDNVLNGVKWTLPGFLVLVGCNSKRRFEWTLISMIGAIVIFSLLVIKWMPLGLLTDGDALQRRAARVINREVGFHRTDVSVLLATGFWIIVAAQYYFKRRYTLGLYACAVITFFGMLLTAGRAGYLTWALLGLVVAAGRWKRYLIILPPLLILAIGFVPSVKERIFTGIESDDQFNSAPQDSDVDLISAGRTSIWPRVVEQINERPVTGFGLESLVSTGLTLEFLRDYGLAYRHPHNAYLQLMIDQGLVGLIPVLLLFIILTRRSWLQFCNGKSQWTVSSGCIGLAVTLGILIPGFVGQSFYPSELSVFTWCGAALAIRGYEIYRANEEEKKSHSIPRRAAKVS